MDLSLVLSLATVLGMAMAVAERGLAHELLGALLAPGLALVYLAGDVPAKLSRHRYIRARLLHHRRLR